MTQKKQTKDVCGNYRMYNIVIKKSLAHRRFCRNKLTATSNIFDVAHRDAQSYRICVTRIKKFKTKMLNTFSGKNNMSEMREFIVKKFEEDRWWSEVTIKISSDE